MVVTSGGSRSRRTALCVTCCCCMVVVAFWSNSLEYLVGMYRPLANDSELCASRVDGAFRMKPVSAFNKCKLRVYFADKIGRPYVAIFLDLILPIRVIYRRMDRLELDSRTSAPSNSRSIDDELMILRKSNLWVDLSTRLL